MIKIHNIRAGFATNSSSTHSVVIIPKPLVGTIPQRYNDDTIYGWDNFVLTTVDSKMEYFAAQLYTALNRTVDDDVAIQIIYDITGVNISDYKANGLQGDEYISLGVDHQSVWCMDGVDITSSDYISFMHDLREYLSKDEIVIFGGNDNSDGNPHMPTNAKLDYIINDTLGVDYPLSKKMIRKDGDYYTFFSKMSGTKIRVSLKDGVAPYKKSTTPELVDLKITQFCPYGCSFCYMGSTKEGVHASLERIKHYVDMMADLKVMEIALGGGEPTTHPNFVEILEYIDSKGMVVNFTTFSVKWLNDEQIVNAVRKYVSAIGVSVLSEKDLNKVIKINEVVNDTAKFNRKNNISILAQHVIGASPQEETARLLIAAWTKGLNVLLLGYKKVGFGKDYTPYPIDQVLLLLKLSIVEKKYYYSEVKFLAVDTAFVSKFKKFLRELGISNKLISSPEGKFSMYIDAVEGRAAPSSYCSIKKYSEMPGTSEELKTLYQKY